MAQFSRFIVFLSFFLNGCKSGSEDYDVLSMTVSKRDAPGSAVLYSQSAARKFKELLENECGEKQLVKFQSNYKVEIIYKDKESDVILVNGNYIKKSGISYSCTLNLEKKLNSLSNEK